LRSAALDILGISLLSAGGTNRNYQIVKLIVEPRLTDATDWFLFDLSKNIKPFILQEFPINNSINTRDQCASPVTPRTQSPGK